MALSMGTSSLFGLFGGSALSSTGVEDEDLMSSQTLSGAASGAATGAAAGGAPGAVVGAVIGGAMGLFQSKSAREDQEAAEEDREEALRRASFLKTMARRQTESLTSVGRNLGAQKPSSSSFSVGGSPTSAVGQGIQTSAGTF